MSVNLEPSELSFRRPFTKEVNQTLHLRNPNNDPIAFKVKTTAPRRYCVRPNSGRIEPGQHVEVQVLLQAMKEDPPLDTKCRDKFLVQSVAVSADKEFSNVSAIWHDVEKTNKSLIQEQKIRVSFLPADSDEAAVTNGVAPHEAESPEQISPAAKYDTPAVPTRTAPLPPITKSEPEDEKADMKRETAPSPPIAEDAKSQTSSKVDNIPGSGDELKSELADARAQIRRLKEELSNQGVRLRKPEAKNNAETSGTNLQQQHARQAEEMGVPLKVVAGLCLLSFLLAYIFF